MADRQWAWVRAAARLWLAATATPGSRPAAARPPSLARRAWATEWEQPAQGQTSPLQGELPGRVLGEIERVLRPGGVLWMVEHVRPQTPVLARLATFVTPGWRRIAHNCHLDRPTIETLRSVGWQVEILRRRGVLVKLKAWR